MNYIVSANTDIGIVKKTNQDSLSVKILNTKQGRMVFAVLCDGMGGLDKGELASASVIKAFDNWVRNEFPPMCNQPLNEDVLKREWERIILSQNRSIGDYGDQIGIKLGTTVVTLLLTDEKYYVMNVGDSRAYELSDDIYQITKDQTFLTREVELGHMTEEQALMDERRSILLQCVGASDVVVPDMFVGKTRQNAVYLLCSDGFRHEITSDEIFERLQPGVLFDDKTMSKNTEELIEINKQREERDNISVVLVRTF